ncbi:DNA translocase FtsK 4TM domain-containing protein [Candidatus Saccharibacteria bacterium]|nr:DNA translocase FtsK 4TM domain-containing protein [Candidatus Saccharibacteria bacterium]
MAKKRRKSTKRKNTKEVKHLEHELPGGFWRQIAAVLMIALALFFVITWFGQGGTILNKIHEFILKGLGFATYFIPALLVYLAVKIFRADDNRVAVPVYIASILMIFWLSGIAAIWKNGGIVGQWLNSLATNVLNQGVVIFIYIILIFITAAFILQLSPVTFFKGTKNLVKTGGKKPELQEAKGKKLGQLEIKVNSGLESPEPVAKLQKGFKVKKAPELPEKTPIKEEKALVASSDPDWKMPSLDLLEKKQSPADAGNIQQNAYIIKSTFAEFGIDVEMEGANVGPSITQYTMRAPAGINLSKISARDKELAYKLAAKTIRIEAPIPGTQLIGVEVPNIKSATVSLRGIIESPEWKKDKGPLRFAIGKNMSGKSVIGDLARMRHLLIAGTTGSGKSVMMNTLLISLLFNHSPADLRLIVVDIKKVEMEAYTDIPHLLTPVINDETKAVSALKWAVGEMNRRFTTFKEARVKNIAEYNEKMASDNPPKDQDGEKSGDKMPYIVIVIDEMAQIMMQAGKELEPPIVQIAQLGRAAGMHLVLATQKPIVKVITGLIKSNIPSRICFRVLTAMDSRIMLDESGAEKLVGHGDMLLSTEESTEGLERLQGVWTKDSEIYKITDFLREQRAPDYNEEVIAQQVAIKGMGGGGDFGDLGRRFDPSDPLVRKAVEISLSKGKFSTAMLQTYLGKGHGFVSGLAIWFEEIGVIGPQNGNKPRDLLISSLEEFDNLTNI